MLNGMNDPFLRYIPRDNHPKGYQLGGVLGNPGESLVSPIELTYENLKRVVSSDSKKYQEQSLDNCCGHAISKRKCY
jgi:hypothetical protein